MTNCNPYGEGDLAMNASINSFRILKKRGFTQMDLAAQLGLSTRSIGRLKRDGISDTYVVQEIARFLEVPAMELFNSPRE